MIFQPSLLRRTDSTLDGMPIHVGDIVYLQAVDGSMVKAEVIFNAPVDGTIIYTTKPVTRMTESGRVLKLYFRFRHEHVHGIEPVHGKEPILPSAVQHALTTITNSNVSSRVCRKTSRVHQLTKAIAAQFGRFGKTIQ